MKWINTKVVLEWDGEKYVETYTDGYYYNGELALCDVNVHAGYGGGGGGGGAGNGGVVVFVTSNLAVDLIENSIIQFDVSGGTKGSGGSSTGNNGGHGSDGLNGELIKVVM